MKKILVPISCGELLDKISILEIKAFLTDNEYVHKELQELNQCKLLIHENLLEYEVQLKKVNEKLWKIEDKIRQLGEKNKFDEEFIETAKMVYILNDVRSDIKKKINEVTKSPYKEIKIFFNTETL